jgi:hypothetical protein
MFTVFVFAPSAANVSVSGHVLTAGGYAIKGARVYMTGPGGVPMVALTNSFGYYNFEAVESGHDYTARVVSKGWTFQTRIISVTDTLADENFVANP